MPRHYKMDGNGPKSAKKSQRRAKKRIKKIRAAQPKIRGSQKSDRLKMLGEAGGGSTAKAFTPGERYDPKGKPKGYMSRPERSFSEKKKKTPKEEGPAKFRFSYGR